MQFINQNSFTLFGAIAWIGLAVFLLRDGVKTNDVIALAALAVGFGIAFWFLRPGPSTLNEAEQVLARIGKDKPVLLEFQSNY
jgi:hypothetical protein